MISDGLASELDEILPLPAPVGEAEAAPGRPQPTGSEVVVPFNPDAAQRFVRSVIRSKGVAHRRGFPLIGYIGDNGSGKTLTAVRDTLPSLLAGRTVLSTTPLFDPLQPHGTLHDAYRPLLSWREIANLRNADLLLDEVQSVANSRMSSSIPPQLLTAFLQLRKRDVVLRWTTTHWSRIDVTLREVTKAAVICSSSRPDKRAGADGWRPKRKFRVRTVDAASLDGAYTIDIGDPEASRAVRTLSHEKYRRRDWWPWLYDSTALVNVLDHVDAGGWCMSCGGMRPRPKCTCGTIH